MLNNFVGLGDFNKEQDECRLLNEILLKNRTRVRNNRMTRIPPEKRDSHLLSFMKIL